jgi:opacity protein-like surface antigen
MNRLVLILAIFVTCFSESALADDVESAIAGGSGFYLGAGLARDYLVACAKTTTSSNCNNNTFSSNSQQTANLRLLGGYALSKHFAIEGGLSSLGTFEVQDNFGAVVGDAKASSITLAAKGTITFPQGWSIFGELGLARTRMQYSAKACCVLLMPADQSSGGLFLGAGGQYDFSKAMAVRLWTDGQSYDDDGYSGVVGGTRLEAIFKF